MKLIHYLQRKFIYRPQKAKNLSVSETDFDQNLSQDISITTHDNLKLNGWYLRSSETSAENSAHDISEWEEAKPKKPRVVLFLAGNSFNRQRRIPQFNALLELQLDVVCIDYRGYGENPGAPSEENIALDVRTAWNFVVEKLGYAPEEILICGQSLGGAIATRLASELSQEEILPAGLILCSTFTSLFEASKYVHPRLSYEFLMIERYESIEKIKHVKCPLMFLHGGSDPVVPISLGEKLYKAAADYSWNGVPKRFVELPEAGHNDIVKVERDAYVTSLRHFIYNLVPPPDSATMLVASEY